MLIFDIGANEGTVTDKFAKEGHSVIAVEPLPDLCEEIESRYKENDNVTVVNAVVHPSNDPVDFYTIEDNNTLSTLSDDWMVKSRFGSEKSNKVWPIVIKANCVKIDDLIETYGVPDFIKIDVEGSEYDALLTHNKKVNTIISFEWVEELIENTNKCVDHLRNLGYTKYRKSCCHIDHEDISCHTEKIFNESLYMPIEEFYEDIKSCFSPPNPDQEPHAAWGDIYVM